MINFKKVSKEEQKKSRSKSIYRGNQTHTLSMNIKIDNDFSPDNINHNKDVGYSGKRTKDSKGLKYRESLKIL